MKWRAILWRIFFSAVMQKHHGSSRRSRRLAGDRENGRVIAFGVIESGDEMSGAGANGRKAHAQSSSEFGVRAGHESGHLFVPHLNELDLALARCNAPSTPSTPSPG